MPELPEVETIRMGLEEYLVGHTIKSVEVKLPKMLTGDTRDIIDAKVTGVRRFGKGLVIDLNNAFCIAIHIKLTGQLVYKNGTQETKGTEETRIKIIKGTYGTLPNKWTHVIFHLDIHRHSGERSDSRIKERSWTSQDDHMGGATLFYNDFRQFGWLKIVKQEQLQDLEFFKGLGPEFPLYSSSEQGESRSSRQVEDAPRGARTITFDEFSLLLQKSKTAIKPLLMDQKKMSGLGNIYTNDALNLAKINPKRSASSLSTEETKTLFEAIETVLQRGLRYGGASELSFINALGQEGKYQEHFLTYGRDGKKCFNCGGIIERITLGGRGTFFCSACQR